MFGDIRVPFWLEIVRNARFYKGFCDFLGIFTSFNIQRTLFAQSRISAPPRPDFMILSSACLAKMDPKIGPFY